MRHISPPSFVTIVETTRREVILLKRQLLAVSLVLVMLLGIAAQASGPMKAPIAKPTLAFNGTTATCTAYVRGNSATDTVAATVKLWTGSTCLRTWTARAKTSVKIEETATVSRGKTYKLTVDYTVNGVKQPQKSVTRTCP